MATFDIHSAHGLHLLTCSKPFLLPSSLPLSLPLSRSRVHYVAVSLFFPNSFSSQLDLINLKVNRLLLSEYLIALVKSERVRECVCVCVCVGERGGGGGEKNQKKIAKLEK